MNRAIAVGLLLAVAACGPGDDEPGADWSLILDGDDLDRVVLSAWGSGPDDVYVVGGGLGNGLGALVAHYDGNVWTEVDTGATDTFWWTFGLSAGDVFFVGEQGSIYRKQGDTVQRMVTPTDLTIYGIWGESADDLWAVGGDPLAATPTPVILRFDGTTWTDDTPAVDIGGALFKVWGNSPSDVFACGQDGTMLHYDGSDWVAQDTGTNAPLFTVHSLSADEVWAVGGPPARVLRYDGSAWAEEDTGLPASVLNGVAVAPDGDVIVVGMSGIKFRRRDGEWLDETNQQPIIDLHAVWSEYGETYAVGGNFFAPGTPGSVRIGVVGYFGTDPPADSL